METTKQPASSSVNVKSQIDEDRVNRRKLVLQELLNTEVSFYNHFDILIKNYVEPCTQEKVLTNDEILIIFNNCAEVKEQSKRFLSAMNQQLEMSRHGGGGDGNDDDDGGGVNYALAFSNTFNIDIFMTYVMGYQKALTTLSSIKQKNKSFEAFLERRRNSGVDPSSHLLGLEAYLVMPVGRCPRYLLLFQELLKLTSNDHPHYTLITTTISSIQADLNKINESIQQSMANEEKETEDKDKEEIDLQINQFQPVVEGDEENEEAGGERNSTPPNNNNSSSSKCNLM